MSKAATVTKYEFIRTGPDNRRAVFSSDHEYRFCDEAPGRKGDVFIFSWRSTASVVGTRDVRLIELFRYHRHNVDRLDLYRSRSKGNVGPLVVGISDHGVLPGVHGQVDPPI